MGYKDTLLQCFHSLSLHTGDGNKLIWQVVSLLPITHTEGMSHVQLSLVMVVGTKVLRC